jgi:hypothetical protein
MTEELVAALKSADSVEEVAIAFTVGLEAAYRSHPRDGVAAAIQFLAERVAFREQAAAKAAEEAATAEAARVASKKSKSKEIDS